MTDCPDGSVCVPTGRMGDLCAAGCRNDADCRADAGYVCDPGRHACVLPFMTSPALAACPDPATSQRPPNTRWEPMQVLTSATTPGAYQFEPSAALADDGTLVIVHAGGAATFTDPSFLGVIRVPPSGPPVELPLVTTKRMHFDPWITADRTGALHAVWLGHDGGGVDRNAEVGYARSSDGGATWTEPTAVHDLADCPPGATACLDKPMIAAGPQPRVGRGPAPVGDAVRLFYAAGDVGMRMRTSLDGGRTFAPAVPVVPATYGDVAIDPRGAIHVAAVAGSPRGAAAWGSVDNAILYVRSIDGATFTAPVAITGPGESVPFFFVNPSLVTDATGQRIHVAYAAGDPDGAWNLMLASSVDRGATWTRRLLAGTEPACSNHAVPELAMRKSGKLLATWFEYQGGAGYRAFTTCERDGSGCRPPAPLGPPMATYELVRHSPRWLGEYGALVIDERRRRLHAVWTQVLGESPRGVARIVHTVGTGN